MCFEVICLHSGLIDFAIKISELKCVVRKGWVSQVGIEMPESVADHSFACALLAMCLGDLKGLDTIKLIRLALLHDFHEALIGDYDYLDKQRIGIEQAKKNQQQAIKNTFIELPSGIRETYISLAEEYLRQETAEAKFVKQIDKLEMIIQALYYEKCGYDKEKFEPFWKSIEGTFTDSDMKIIFKLLNKERK